MSVKISKQKYVWWRIMLVFIYTLNRIILLFCFQSGKVADMSDNYDTLNDVFCSGEFAALLGVTPHELNYWIKVHIVSASIKQAKGHGSRRIFDRYDLRQALLVRRLRQANWKPRQILDALPVIGPILQYPDHLQTPILIHEKNALLILCRNQDGSPSLMDASCPGQHVMVIALETLEEETRLSIARSK